MPFWPCVLLTLIGAPGALLFTGMGAIFAAGGYANGGSKTSVNGVVYGWLAFAWVLVSMFCAFGLAPAWRAMHGGAENFAGALGALVDWLVRTGIAGLLGAAALRWQATVDRDRLSRWRLVFALRWLLLSLGLALYAAIAGWLVWPLVLWPVHGNFAWPEAATGWAHTGMAWLVLVALMLIEEATIKLRKPRAKPGE